MRSKRFKTLRRVRILAAPFKLLCIDMILSPSVVLEKLIAELNRIGAACQKLSVRFFMPF